MFHRRLSLKLLAPTLLVSVVLILGCALVAFYLHRLNVNVSAVLSENVQSARVASQLQTTTSELIRILRQAPPGANRSDRVEEQNREIRELLIEAESFANLESEQVLVDQLRDRLREYLNRWEMRPQTPEQARVFDLELISHLETRVLTACHELRDFNAGQIENSARANRTTVQQLEWGLILVGLGAPFGGLLLGYAIARGVRHSIYQLSVRIRDAAGRLNRELGSVTLAEETDLPALHKQMQGVIVEIERVVQQLQQREREVLRAEQLAAVGQVAAGVAHELRNPLTSIKMLVQTALEDRHGDDLPPEDLMLMESEIRRMEHIIRLFIDFARPPRSERRLTNLRPIVERSVALVEGRARKQKTDIHTDLPAHPLMRNIDGAQIQQVMMNLLLNALDSVNEGGTVRVAVNETGNGHAPSPLESATHGEVRVTVTDDGPGIPSHIMERLFEPFVSSKESGLGLGLSISKRMVESHGGSIHGRNNPEGGATFSVTLPD